MAIRFSCEECGRAYSYKNRQKGHKFHCRECNASLIVPDKESAPDKSPSASPKKRKKSNAPQKKKSQGDLRGVHAGFTLILWSLLAEIVGILLLSLASSLNPSMATPAAILVLLGTGLGLLGKCRFLSAPKQANLVDLTSISIFLDILGLLLAVCGLVTRLPAILDSAVPLFPAAASLTFLYVVGRLARYLQESSCVELASFVTRYTHIGIATAAVGVLVPPVMAIAALVILVAFVRYIRLLLDLKAAIRSRI
jgi:hypothetical protein